MENVIKIVIRSVYGNQLVYPANPLGDKFANLLGTKTFNAKTLAGMRDMGYQIEKVSEASADAWFEDLLKGAK